MNNISITPLGDRGITVRLGDRISVELTASVVAHAAAVTAAGIRGITDVVPSYSTIGIFYDSLAVSFDDLELDLRRVVSDVATRDEKELADGALVRIKVRYDGEDLDEVARRTKLSRDEVVRIHTEREYRVFVVGFVPGWGYLGQLDPRIIVARRDSPRKRIAAGAVAIAEGQTGVYPGGSPGGWNLIGTTSETMFDATREPPALLRVGDRVRFEAID